MRRFKFVIYNNEKIHFPTNADKILTRYLLKSDPYSTYSLSNFLLLFLCYIPTFGIQTHYVFSISWITVAMYVTYPSLLGRPTPDATRSLVFISSKIPSVHTVELLPEQVIKPSRVQLGVKGVQLRSEHRPVVKQDRLSAKLTDRPAGEKCVTCCCAGRL